MSKQLMLVLSAAAMLFAGAAGADPAAPSGSSLKVVGEPPLAEESVPMKAKVKKPSVYRSVPASGRYERCLKENLADAEYFCSKHAEGCQAEKDGAAQQCRDEAAGKRFTG